MRPACGGIERWKEWIIPRDWNWPTLWVNRRGGIAGAAVQDGVVDPLVDGGGGDVVVKELTVLHQHEGVSGVKVGDIGMNHN